jgi:hypothetical protein
VLSVFDVVLILVVGGLKMMLSIYFVAACIRGIVFNSNLRVQPAVAPTSELNFCVFIPSLPRCISMWHMIPVIGQAVVLNSVPSKVIFHC